MATTQITFGAIGYGGGPTPAPGMIADSGVPQSFTPSGSNQVTSSPAPGTNCKIGVRIATDTQVYVSFGASPNATSDTKKYLVPAGAIEYLFCNGGEYAAVTTG